jgi:hypothetical protein
MAKQARELEIAYRADSKKRVAESNGKKIICPKCSGGKKMSLHGYDSTGVNPYRFGTLAYNGFEQNRKSITIVDCDRCGGTGVIDK